MFIGALFRTVKGGYDAVAIRKKIKSYNQELSGEILESFTPYEQFFVQERILLAEYMIKISKLKAKNARIEQLFKLRERMNSRMKQIVEKAERELEARNATKLDLAKIVASLRELSLAVDRDLNNYRKEFSEEQNKVRIELKELDEKIGYLSNRVDKQGREALAIQKKVQTLSSNFDSINKGVTKQNSTHNIKIGLIWLFNVMVVVLLVFLVLRH